MQRLFLSVPATSANSPQLSGYGLRSILNLLSSLADYTVLEEAPIGKDSVW